MSFLGPIGRPLYYGVPAYSSSRGPALMSGGSMASATTAAASSSRIAATDGARVSASRMRGTTAHELDHAARQAAGAAERALRRQVGFEAGEQEVDRGEPLREADRRRHRTGAERGDLAEDPRMAERGAADHHAVDAGRRAAAGARPPRCAMSPLPTTGTRTARFTAAMSSQSEHPV